MANFPDKEADVVALVQSMIAGYTAHAVDFPSADPIGLQAALSGFLTDKQSQEDAKAQAQIATATKTGTLDSLESLMKDSLKASELDVASDPDKLLEIGWGSKAAPVPFQRLMRRVILSLSMKGRAILLCSGINPFTIETGR